MKKNNRFICLCIAILAASSLGATPVDIPLANPSFESPGLDTNNSWYGGVDGWGSIPTGGVGTTFAQPWMSASPAPDGSQFAWADLPGMHVFQQVGTIEPNCWYTLTVDLFPIQNAATTRAEVLIEETDLWAATMASAYLHPAWDPGREDFTLPANQWTTVTVTFNSANFATLAGNNMRIRIAGDNLAVDNVRLSKETDRTYFVSSSYGNDANDGRSANTPWQTFAHLDNFTLFPGETVALNRGDAWSGSLHLWGKGVSGALIELTAYGSGNAPRILNGDLLNGNCIVIEGASHWRINQIDGRDAKVGLYLRYDNDFGNEDVVVEDCYFEGMSDPTFDPALFNYERAWSSGIFLGGKIGAGNDSLNVIDNLTVRNCQFINCAVGFGTSWFFPFKNHARLTNVFIEDCIATKTLSGGVWLNHITGGHCKRVRVYDKRDVKGVSLGTGTTGGFIQGCEDFLIDHCEFSETARIPGEADGTGFDFEGDCKNITFTNNVMRDNDGAGILLLSTEAPHTGILIADCTLYSNSLNPLGNPGENDFEFKSAGGAASQGTITNVGIYRNSATTSGWFSDSWNGFSISNTRQLYYSGVSGLATYWEFNTDGNFENWHSFNQWGGATVTGGALIGTSTGVDPYTHTPSTFIDSNLFPKVRMNLSSTAGSFAQIFFITDTDAVWDAAKSVTFPVIPDGNLHDYLVDMTTCPDFKGVVTMMRLDPTSMSGASIELDYFRPVMADGVTTGPGGNLPANWIELLNNNFETGMQAFTDGGADCSRSASDAPYAHQGTYCVRLRDNSGSASSMYMNSGINATGFSDVKVSFYFYPNSMENGEDFFLEVYNGSGWSVIGQFAAGTDFTNGSFHFVERTIGTNTLNNPSDLRFRIRCDASANSDQVFIDEVVVQGR